MTVYNWDLMSTVSVDLTGILAVGTAFEVHNAADFFGAPVLVGLVRRGVDHAAHDRALRRRARGSHRPSRHRTRAQCSSFSPSSGRRPRRRRKRRLATPRHPPPTPLPPTNTPTRTPTKTHTPTPTQTPKHHHHIVLRIEAESPTVTAPMVDHGLHGVRREVHQDRHRERGNGRMELQRADVRHLLRLGTRAGGLGRERLVLREDGWRR